VNGSAGCSECLEPLADDTEICCPSCSAGPLCEACLPPECHGCSSIKSGDGEPHSARVEVVLLDIERAGITFGAMMHLYRQALRNQQQGWLIPIHDGGAEYLGGARVTRCGGWRYLYCSIPRPLLPLYDAGYRCEVLGAVDSPIRAISGLRVCAGDFNTRRRESSPGSAAAAADPPAREEHRTEPPPNTDPTE